MLVKKKHRVRRCGYCLGELSRVARTTAFGEMFLICLSCGRMNTIGKSNSVSTGGYVDSSPVMVDSR